MMTRLSFYIRVFICIVLFGGCLFAYIDGHNEVTSFKLKGPVLAKDLKALEEKNRRLKYDIDEFESPANLMNLARQPEFSHLKFPYENEVSVMKEGIALNVDEEFSHDPFAIPAICGKSERELPVVFGASN